jgi:hypothetical protein
MKYRFVPMLVSAGIATTAQAFAEASGSDRSLAQSLFEQAKQLMVAGKYEEACPKLAESQRLDPGGGTLLNLGLCHERQGKTASAWSDFKEALSVARRDNRSERIRDSEEHIAALEAKLPWLTVSVTRQSKAKWCPSTARRSGRPCGERRSRSIQVRMSCGQWLQGESPGPRRSRLQRQNGRRPRYRSSKLNSRRRCQGRRRPPPRSPLNPLCRQAHPARRARNTATIRWVGWWEARASQPSESARFSACGRSANGTRATVNARRTSPAHPKASRSTNKRRRRRGFRTSASAPDSSLSSRAFGC